MIKKVKIRSFKKFAEESFDLSDSIILAGPNNSGKTTLLQALVVWNGALRKWLTERGPESGSKARKRTGVAITRKDFTAVPLREMNLLWTDRSTALYKGELAEGQKPGTPRILEVAVSGQDSRSDWKLQFEYTYRYPDLIHARPSNNTPIEPILSIVRDLQVVHVPPFSGIGAEETRYDKEYQDLLIGQGKPGDILRNLILEVHRDNPGDWKLLVRDIQRMFGYELLPPVYSGGPFINCEYKPGLHEKLGGKSIPKLDISTAGSGFLQVLMLLGFFYARPTSILLLDEPDAHLHVILQKQVYDLLREIARRRSCQLIIATHSEVLIDATSPRQIVSFFSRPKPLKIDTDRDQVRKALKRLTSQDLLLAEESPNILYVEGESDLNLLREWATVLKHPALKYLRQQPFWHSNMGRHPREARAHFFALRAVHRKSKGILILDGDNRSLPDREIVAEGLVVYRWKRYEAENYLLHPECLSRFVKALTLDLFANAAAAEGIEFLRKQLPPAVLDDPLGDHEYLNVTPASKTLLPGFFKSAGVAIHKNEYYQVAGQMKSHEIPTEVQQMLDQITAGFESKK